MAKEKFTLQFDALLNVSQMKGALNSVQGELNKLKLPSNVTRELQNTFQKLSTEVKNFENATSGGVSSKSDFTRLESSAKKILGLYDKLQNQVQGLQNLSGSSLEKLFPEQVVNNIKAAKAALIDYQRALQTATTNLEKAQSAQDKIQSKINSEQGKKAVTSEEYKKISGDLKEAESQLETYRTKIREVSEEIKNLENSLKAPKKSSTYRQYITELDELKQKEVAFQQEVTRLATEKAGVTTNEKQAEALAKLNIQYQEALQKVAEYKQALENLQSSSAGGAIDQLLNTIGQLTGTDLSSSTNKIEDATAALENYINAAAQGAQGGLQAFGQALTANRAPLEQTNEDLRRGRIEQEQYDARVKDVSALKHRIQYFLGLNNAVNLLRRAIRGAFNTIKELDAVMTETAVVTNFTVSDMWNQLPRYTQAANELGVTTKGAYETMTLFYQQGLDTNEAFALGTETMKMARIAGIDYTKATDAMTAALRGFNMELNETSAQRVNDVYSQLAAKTASNVEEISTAMSKAASIAHNAGMEFETTAAYLSQIIETTREAPETAGTALKTVIARFTELKKSPSAISEVDGEAVDANKIETALKSVGIALRDAKGEFRDLDDVFLDLNAKWDSLTKNEQRYVATMAAGSRQQSRFIAMMSDYSRTQKLVGEAYDANGASQKQYEKTLDSLESKLNKLKNAWNEFLMGLSNSTIIKGAVDALTKFLTLLNKTSKLGKVGGALSKWAITIGSFAALRGLFKGGSAGLAKLGGLIGKSPLGKILNIGQGSELVKSSATAGKIWTTAVIDSAKRQLAAAVEAGQIEKEAAVAAAAALDKAAVTEGATGSGGLGALGGWKALIVALIAVAVVAAAALIWKNTSFEGRLQSAQNLADSLGEAAKEAQALRDSLEDISKTYADYQTAIAEAASKEELDSAIAEKNAYLEDLRANNPEYSRFIKSSLKNGQLELTIDEEELKKSQEEAAEAASRASGAALLQQARVAQMEAEHYQSLADKQMMAASADGQTQDYIEQNNQAYQNYINSATEATIEAIQLATEGYLEFLKDQNLEPEISKAIATILAGSDFTVDLPNNAVFDSGNIGQMSAIIRDMLMEEGWTREEIYNQKTGYLSNEAITAAWSMMGGTGAAPEVSAWGQEFGWGSSIVNAYQQLGTLYNDYISEAKAKDIADIFEQDSSFDSLIDALNGNMGDTLRSSIEDAMGGYEESLNALVDQGILQSDKVQDLMNLLQRQYQEQQWQEAKIALATGQQMLRGGFDEGAVGIYGSWGKDQRAIFDDIIAKTTAFGEAQGEMLLPVFAQLQQGIDAWEKSGFQSLFDNIDVSNPIQSMAQLQEIINTSTGDLRDYAEALRDGLLQTTEFSRSSQVQFALTSEKMAELNEDITKLVKTNTKLTGDNIIEFADSCEELKEILDNDIISAEGLAAILTEVAEGSFDLMDISDALLAAADRIGGLDAFNRSTLSWINEFDPGYDQNDAHEFIKTAYELSSEAIKNGQWGSQQMRAYQELIFGPFQGDTGAGYESWIKTNTQWLKENQDSMYSAWKNAINQDSGLASQYGIKIQEDGQIFIDTSERTTEEMVEALTDWGSEIGLTAHQVEMMITDYDLFSPDFWLDLRRNDTKAGIADWLREQQQKDGQAIAVTEKQLQQLADLYGVDITKIKEIIAGLEESDGVEVKLIDVDADPVEDLQQYVSEVKKQLDILDNYTNQYYDSNGRSVVASLENMKTAYADAGYAEGWQDEVRALWERRQGGEDVELEIDGTLVFSQLDIDSDEDVVDLIAEWQENQVEQAAQQTSYDQLAATIGAGFQQAMIEMSEAGLFGEGEGLTLQVKTDTTDGADNINNLGETYNTTKTNIESFPIGIKINYKFPDLQSRIDSIVRNIQASVNVNVKSGGNAAGGYVPSYASGTRKLNPGVALTGEEGPEIVWNKKKGYAYITGESHPEFQNLQPGDRVFNAQETRKILGNAATGGKVPSYATGYGVQAAASYSNTNNKKNTVAGKKSSKSSSEKVEANAEFWENELDWLFNLLEDIAALQQEANQLQALQDAYMSDNTKTGNNLYDLLVKQLGNLNAQLLGNQELLTRREDEMREFMAQTNRFPELLRYNETDRTLEIDWDKIDQLDKTSYDMVTEFISKAEDIQSNIRDAENAVLDVEKELREFENVWRDEYIDFEETVGQALINSQQKVIDNYSELSDTLSDNNSQILDSLSESISLSRQIRDNTKTEEKIADMEARLAYLRRDTTGGNQAEIQKLEKELEDARQSYEDTLIDQALDRLKDENDAAAEQRQQEIDLMQAQLDYAEQSGEFNKEIHDLIKGARDEGNGGFRVDSELMALLREDANFNAKTAEAQNQWMDELLTTFKPISGYLMKQEQEKDEQFEIQVINSTQDELKAHKAIENGVNNNLNEENQHIFGGDIGSEEKAGQGQYHIDVNKDYEGWFQNEDTGDWYYTKKGGNIQTGWFKSPSTGKWYYLDPQNGGRMATGEVTMENGNTYWMGTSGAFTYGWAKGNNGDWYYTKNGTAYNGWTKYDGVWYYVDHGKMARGWTQTSNGKISYFNPSNGHYGGSTKGVNIDGETYYFDANGYLKTEGLTDQQLAVIQAKIKRGGYRTGGLTSKTGLAMLHGTPSAPEYVLNATQTQAFLKLADVLPSVLNQNTGAAGALGGINLNLVMNVDEIGSDYDVDRIANRVKEIIYNAGSYRNVNTLNFLR